MRTGDKGFDHNGQPKANYEPGADIIAKVVVLGEGPRGTLAKQAVSRLNLDDGREPQVYAAGVKELWQLPDDRFKAGAVIHTLGYPLPTETFGGGFIYGMAGQRARHRFRHRVWITRIRRPIRTTSCSA